jgi:mRNA interferase RelE/StbE
LREQDQTIQQINLLTQRSLENALVYKVRYKGSVEKDLRHIDLKQAKRIISAIENKRAEAPRKLGEPLHGEWEGYWTFYVKPYRVIYEVFDRDETVRIYRIAHRKDAYR